ncbi:MAG: hypothetical protein DDT32_00873 [Syntrophomonadaceae bacterium]|nr:hypothetical protein [Bacillota bacterium]
MGYREKVLDKINAMEHRADEMRFLWQTLINSFEEEGADGVANELAGQIGKVRERFDTLLEKLEEMA